MKCPKCGTKNEDYSLYCASCKTSLVDAYERGQIFVVVGLLLVGLLAILCGIIVNPEFLVGGAVFVCAAVGLKIAGSKSIRRMRAKQQKKEREKGLVPVPKPPN